MAEKGCRCRSEGTQQKKKKIISYDSNRMSSSSFCSILLRMAIQVQGGFMAMNIPNTSAPFPNPPDHHPAHELART